MVRPVAVLLFALRSRMATPSDPPKSTDRPDPPGDLPPHDPADEAADLSGADGLSVESQMLGEFKLIRRLGQGGMAQVYLAEQTSLGRKVALKVLRPERLQTANNLKRFLTEATAAAALSHPHIVAVYLLGEHEGRNYIVQEYVSGGNLRELITRKGPPEVNQAVEILKQTAAALQAAHEKGIVHRDIKPENILLTPQGDVKVADFGLAQLTLEGERVNLTQEGVTMGTPLYMSPEQVSASQIDARSDLYSLGVTAYHLLSGKPPFAGKTAMAVAMAHVRQKPQPLLEQRDDLPPVLCRIVHKLLAKDPKNRYQSAADLLRDLNRFSQLGARGGAGQERAGPETVDEPDETDGEEGRGRVKPGPTGSWPRRLAGAIWRGPDRGWLGYLLRVLGWGVLVGGGAAGAGWLMRTPDPFAAEPGRRADVPSLGSAEKQYYHAMTLADSIPAWQAVIDLYPEKQLFRNYALKQLAMLHLAQGNYNEAQGCFDQLAALPGSETKLRAVGQAGQAILLQHVRNDYRASQELLSKLAGAYSSLDPWLQEQVADAIQRNRRQLQEDLNSNLKSILEQRPSEQGRPAELGPPANGPRPEGGD
jgi:serine/threonine-protein kinase